MKNLHQLIQDNHIQLDSNGYIHLNDSEITKKEFIGMMKEILKSDEEERYVGKKLNKRRKSNDKNY